LQWLSSDACLHDKPTQLPHFNLRIAGNIHPTALPRASTGEEKVETSKFAFVALKIRKTN